MPLPPTLLPWLWAIVLALPACSKGRPEPGPGAGVASSPVAATAPPATLPAATARTAPPEGPTEDELLGFLSAEYERIRDAGGMPVTVTASGKSTVLQPRVYSLRKTGCKPVPREPLALECSVVAMVTLMERDRDPKSHGERIFVQWDAAKSAWQPKQSGRRQR